MDERTYAVGELVSGIRPLLVGARKRLTLLGIVMIKWRRSTRDGIKKTDDLPSFCSKADLPVLPTDTD